MKTQRMALSGLLITALFGAGCRITHYGPPEGKLAPNEEAVCRATCERLIEEQALSLDGAKSCLSSCGPRTSPAKVAVAQAKVERPAREPERAEVERAEVERAEPVRREDVPCPGTRKARPRAPQVECPPDSDCAEEN